VTNRCIAQQPYNMYIFVCCMLAGELIVSAHEVGVSNLRYLHVTLHSYRVHFDGSWQLLSVAVALAAHEIEVNAVWLDGWLISDTISVHGPTQYTRHEFDTSYAKSIC